MSVNVKLANKGTQVVMYENLHCDIPLSPMQFTSMDSICQLHPKPLAGDCYALTVMCMQKGYFVYPHKIQVSIWCVIAYAKFAGSHCILSDNIIEFQNSLFTNVANSLELKIKYIVYLIIKNQMVKLKVFTTFLKIVYQSMWLEMSNEIKWCHWCMLFISFYQKKIQGKVHSFNVWSRAPLTFEYIVIILDKIPQHDKNILSWEALKNI